MLLSLFLLCSVLYSVSMPGITWRDLDEGVLLGIDMTLEHA